MRDAAARICAVFGLGRPIGELAPLSYRSSQTWMLPTADGHVFVKHVVADGWRDDFERAMAFERQARATGIAMPRPIAPARSTPGATEPAGGYAVEVAGIGTVRAYEWVDGRALADDDDVAEWLGSTLGRLHGLVPVGRDGTRVAGPEWYRLHDPQMWQGWLRDGRRQGRSWAPVLAQRLTAVLSAAQWVEQGFDNAGDYVVTHRDVEPWNVMMTRSGPVLIDWDTAGPDSARLEAAHATLAFAMRGRAVPDTGEVERTRAAYVREGGADLRGRDDAAARRVGILLGRLAERLRMSLGLQDAGPHDLREVEARAAQRISELPQFVAAMRDYARKI